VNVDGRIGHPSDLFLSKAKAGRRYGTGEVLEALAQPQTLNSSSRKVAPHLSIGRGVQVAARGLHRRHQVTAQLLRAALPQHTHRTREHPTPPTPVVRGDGLRARVGSSDASGDAARAMWSAQLPSPSRGSVCVATLSGVPFDDRVLLRWPFCWLQCSGGVIVFKTHSFHARIGRNEAPQPLLGLFCGLQRVRRRD